MKVYLVVKSIPYEGYGLYSVGERGEAMVFGNEKDANVYRDEMASESDNYEDWEVIEFEVK